LKPAGAVCPKCGSTAFQKETDILDVWIDSGVSAAVDYQLRQILGEQFFRFQTTLDTANDDMDDASPANLAALKCEASRIIETQRAEIDRVCQLLGQP